MTDYLRNAHTVTIAIGLIFIGFGLHFGKPYQTNVQLIITLVPIGIGIIFIGIALYKMWGRAGLEESKLRQEITNLESQQKIQKEKHEADMTRVKAQTKESAINIIKLSRDKWMDESMGITDVEIQEMIDKISQGK